MKMKRLICLLASSVAMGCALAQTPPPSPAPAQKRIGALKLSKVTVRELAARLTKESGFLVIADDTLASSRVSLTSVGGSLEAVLAQLAPQLPKGSLLRRTHLPASAATSPDPNAEVVSLIIQINDALAGPLNDGARPEPDALIVQGRVVPKDKVPMVLAALDLKPVFLLTNPKTKSPAGSFASMQGDIMRLWQNMTPEQRKSAVEKQWDDFLNMDPAARKTYMQQMMEQGMGIAQKIQQLPPDQVKELFGGLIPPPGGAGGAGG
jgi:hypothetical protein